MKTKLIPVITMCLAGALSWLMCMLYKRNLMDMMIIILISVVIFAVVGFIAETIIEGFLIVKVDDEIIENFDDEDEENENNSANMENIDVDMNFDMDNENYN